MKFSWMKKINRLKSDLNAKISVVFQQYGVELDEVEKLYEKNKKDAILARDLPPVAGHIAWSRQIALQNGTYDFLSPQNSTTDFELQQLKQPTNISEAMRINSIRDSYDKLNN